MQRLDSINLELEELETLRRRRFLKRLGSRGPDVLEFLGRKCVNFSSNDYLGLSQHPMVVKAAQQAIVLHNASTASSRLICGNLELHERLEEEVACFKGKEAALVFSSGYLANIGIITALAGADDQVFSDSLNHASIIDGCRLSRARTFVYRHKDLNHLEDLLQQAPSCRRRLMVSDAVFSMDGDLADLPGLVELSERYDSMLILDEAHATGVLGSSGRGLFEYCVDQGKLAAGKDRVDVAMGTFSKALGSFGGFAACSSKVRELLLNKARPFIFSTALPPSAVGAAGASLRLIQQESAHRRSLWQNCSLLKQELSAAGFDLKKSESPILPLVFGLEGSALRVSELLLAAGYYVPAIRPPSVPEGSSRLRVTVTATHSQEQIMAFSNELIAVVPEAGHLDSKSQASALR